MRKGLKILGYSLLALLLVGGLGIGFFVYRVVYGLPFYESEAPEISLKQEGFSVLLFNKTNGFRHGEAISSSTKAFEQMAEQARWNLIVTESGGVFNPKQLALFDVVVWNNVTGKVLKAEQREAFKQYMEQGEVLWAYTEQGIFPITGPGLKRS